MEKDDWAKRQALYESAWQNFPDSNKVVINRM